MPLTAPPAPTIRIFFPFKTNFFFFNASFIVTIGFKTLKIIFAFKTAFLASSVEVAATANKGCP